MLQRLKPDERIHLIKCVCHFAWADEELSSEERDLIGRFLESLELADEERSQAERWLVVPPPLDEEDVRGLSPALRAVFVEAVQAMVMVDGEIHKKEERLFERFLSWRSL